MRRFGNLSTGFCSGWMRIRGAPTQEDASWPQWRGRRSPVWVVFHTTLQTQFGQLAQRIVDYRTQNGPFATVDALDDVSGIGPATMADLRPLITV